MTPRSAQAARDGRDEGLREAAVVEVGKDEQVGPSSTRVTSASIASRRLARTSCCRR